MADCNNACCDKIDSENEVQNIGEKHHENPHTDGDNANNQTGGGKNKPHTQQYEINAD